MIFPMWNSFFVFIAAKIILGGHAIEVEIADTDRARSRGLMGRDSLKPGTGMLFVYEKPQLLSFWMKNTKIPLSIAFFDERKILFQILDMDPPEESLESYQSSRPAQYALEVPQGWFEANKIRPGMKFSSSLDQGHPVK